MKAAGFWVLQRALTGFYRAPRVTAECQQELLGVDSDGKNGQGAERRRHAASAWKDVTGAVPGSVEMKSQHPHQLVTLWLDRWPQGLIRDDDLAEVYLLQGQEGVGPLWDC